MRRTWLVLATVAIMVATLPLAASPVLAQNFNGNRFFNNHGFFNTPSVFNGVAQESETGNVQESFSVEQTGNNSNQCVTPQQFANTGSEQNAQGVLQYNSVTGGFFGFGSIEPEGSTFTVAPVLSGGCTQQVQQSAAAG